MMVSRSALEIIGKATALAAFLFTVATFSYDQYQKRQGARYAAATDLIERYRADGVRDGETGLVQRMLYYRQDGLDPNDPAQMPDRIAEVMAQNILFGYTGDPDAPTTPYLPQVFEIVDFYSEVAFCRENTICNADILDRFFCSRASAFREENARLLDYYATYASAEDWTDDLDRFLTHCTG